MTDVSDAYLAAAKVAEKDMPDVFGAAISLWFELQIILLFAGAAVGVIAFVVGHSLKGNNS